MDLEKAYDTLIGTVCGRSFKSVYRVGRKLLKAVESFYVYSTVCVFYLI